MYAAPVASHWVARVAGGYALRRVPAYVLSSAKRTSQAWRSWGNKFAGVVGRTFGGGAAVGAAAGGAMALKRTRKGRVTKRRGMPRKRSAPRKQYRRKARIPRKVPRAGTSSGNVREGGTFRSRVYRRVGTRPKLLVPWQIDRLQRMKLENPVLAAGTLAYPGSIDMPKGNWEDSGVTPFPLIIADLTAFNNTNLAADCLTQLGFNSAGDPAFNTIQTQAPSGSLNVGSIWVPEVQNHAPAVTTLFDKIQHHWYDIRLKLYGCSRQAVTYDVMIVKFKRGYFVPTQQGTVVNEISMRASVYQSFVRAQVTNSLIGGNADWKRYVRIVKHQTVKLAAGSSDDSEIIPAFYDLKWFVRDGKVRSYQEVLPQLVTKESLLNTVGFVQKVTTNLSNRPRGTDQMFLIVRATDYIAETTDADRNYTNTPSMDIMIRRKSSLYH